MKRIGEGLAIALLVMGTAADSHPTKSKHHPTKVIQPKVRIDYSALPSGDLIGRANPYFQVGSPEYNARMKRIQEECAELAAKAAEDQKTICPSIVNGKEDRLP